MPIYEYTCSSCSCHFELLRSFSENGTVSCPECGCVAQRIFSPVPVILKGSGFYITDSRSEHNRPSENGKADKIEGGKKEDNKTDKVEVNKKENGKADKVEGGKKEDDKTDKVENSKKSESK